MKTTLTIADSSLSLHRYPLRKNETFQAWDAADEYLIEHLLDMNLPENAHILVFNDSFGAISVWAAHQGYQVTLASDSHVAVTATQKNAELNRIKGITTLSSIDELPKDIDAVVIKLPKMNRLLVWQLQQLSTFIDADIPVVAAAKAKDIHSSTLKLFEKHLGTTTTSLAKKKARLIFCTPTQQLDALPESLSLIEVPEFNLTLKSLPNVFAAESLDIAAHLMLPHIPKDSNFKRIVDLGCGNGVLAIQAARINPQADIHVLDESYMAVSSAHQNLLDNGINPEKIHSEAMNCMEAFAKDSTDLVLCNPPFHQQHTVTDHIAWQMFCDAKRVLKQEGRLLVIGNRHLGYHTKLKRLFGNATLVASNKKFVIIQATKMSLN